MKRLFAGLLGLALLAGCAPAPIQQLPARDALQDFVIEARFALKLTQPDGSQESAGGRLSWTHENGMDRVLLANPLGIGLAEIDAAPGRAVLRTGDGKVYQAEEPDQLLAEATGQPLPLSRLPAWLLGRAATAGTLERDAHTRPLRLQEDGWLIEYRYGDDNPDALPQQLQASGHNIELRLRIETWKPHP